LTPGAARATHESPMDCSLDAGPSPSQSSCARAHLVERRYPHGYKCGQISLSNHRRYYDPLFLCNFSQRASTCVTRVFVPFVPQRGEAHTDVVLLSRGEQKIQKNSS